MEVQQRLGVMPAPWRASLVLGLGMAIHAYAIPVVQLPLCTEALGMAVSFQEYQCPDSSYWIVFEAV
jgi:hypothetical protein